LTENSLNYSMDSAVKHYSSLFKLPSYRRVVTLLALTCLGGGLLSTIILFNSYDGLFNGLLFGFSLFLVNFVLDNILSLLVLRGDPIFNIRRTMAVSLVCWLFWFFFVFVGVFVALVFGLVWWVRLCLLGFSAALIFRVVVFSSTSSLGYVRILAASLFQPFFCIIPFLNLWARINYTISFTVFLFLGFSTIIGIFSSFLFIFLLNRMGKQTLGVPSFSLLKAFLLNWVLDLNAPFEALLEKLGEEQDVEVSLIKLDSSKPKAAIVVPSVHPGPFKNIGSSLLPSMLKTAVENKLECVACVPHGAFGHELDLASQAQNQKLIDTILGFKGFEASEVKASPFVMVNNGVATACCQIFGKFVFISFTLAPETTEDFPQEFGLFVRKEAEKRGLTCLAVVNAHNSINGMANMQKALGSLETVAAACLEKAASLERLSFDVGAATVTPVEFTLKDGMGPGGITVVAVKVGEQKTAYVVVDGNNMVSGLRERILFALRSMGIDESEVFTTDTHAVNAIVLDERGYHPVGEVIDNDKLIEYIKKATSDAIADLERIKNACCYNLTVQHVKVIGAKQLEALCLLIDRSIKRAKKLLPIFVGSGLLLMLFLLLV
jgi:putative membrane protein